MSNTDSPLHIAVKNNNIEIVKALLDSGSDANAPNAEGQTPLSLAAQAGNMEIVTLIAQHSAKQGTNGSIPSIPVSPLPQLPNTLPAAKDLDNYCRRYSVGAVIVTLLNLLPYFINFGDLQQHHLIMIVLGLARK